MFRCCSLDPYSTWKRPKSVRTAVEQAAQAVATVHSNARPHHVMLPLFAETRNCLGLRLKVRISRSKAQIMERIGRERFRLKWTPVQPLKSRPNKTPEHHQDSKKSDRVLVMPIEGAHASRADHDADDQHGPRWIGMRSQPKVA